MTQSLNKLQIRAKILTILSDLKTYKSITQSIFSDSILPIKEIEDKEAVFDILCRELNKPQDSFVTLVKATMLETIPEEFLKDKIFSLISSQRISDQAKYHLVQILRDLGSPIDYDQFFNYFDDPESILDYDTQKLLEFAVVNPETQIDFLDFLSSLPDSDKLTLIDSLNEDYTGDNLANILAPILSCDFSEEVLKRSIEILAESKSSLVLAPLEWFTKNSVNAALLSIAKKSIKMLKLSGASVEKADKFYKLALSTSKVHRCYTTIPDGHNNQGIIFSRIREDKTIQMFALVISNIYGIIDCFGFNFLLEEEFERIISRFYKNDIKVEVSPEYCKYITNKARNLSDIFKEKVNYEFLCWNLLLKDTKELKLSIEDWVEENLKVIQVNEQNISKLFNNDYSSKWFFTPEDSEPLAKLIDEISKEGEHISITIIESKINDYYNQIWDVSTEQQLDGKIINTAYLIAQLNDIDSANSLYSILFSTKYKHEMMQEILKKSIYEYLLSLRQEYKEKKFNTNIFRLKKENDQEKFKLKTIEKMIKEIEEAWTNG